MTLAEEASDALLQWLEYEFGPALKQRLKKNIAAKEEEAAAFAAGYVGPHPKTGEYPSLAPTDPDQMVMWDKKSVQDEPGDEEICRLQGGIYDEKTGMCRFTYDRQGAVDYAITFADQANPYFFFTHGTYPGGTMPNEWWASKEKDGPKPWVGTDCANFVSQALFYGNLPLTEGWAVTTWEALFGEQKYEDYRLRDEHNAWGSALWAGLRTYLEYADDVPNNQYVEIYSSLGERATEAEFGIGNPTSVDEAVNVSEEKLQDIMGGDVMYWQAGPEAHVAMVVGWGPPVAGWDTLNAKDRQLLSPGYKEGYVPYVVDHGPQGEISSEYAVPRPYYAL